MALMLFIVFPLAYVIPGTDAGGSVENVWDAWAMVKNSRPLQIMLLAFFVSVRGAPCWCGTQVTRLAEEWPIIKRPNQQQHTTGGGLQHLCHLRHGASSFLSLLLLPPVVPPSVQ